MALKLNILRTADGHGLAFPTYASKHHMGLRLQAAVPNILKLEVGERVLIPIGFVIGIPKGYCGQVISVPSVVREQGLVVMAAPYLINPADRTPLFVLIQNESRRPQIIKRGDIIAQLLVIPAEQVYWNEIINDKKSHETPESALWIDERMEETTEETVEPKVSGRRVIKSIRERAVGTDEK